MMLETPTPCFELLVCDMDSMLADQRAWKPLGPKQNGQLSTDGTESMVSTK
jgi:hypothetical protein